MQEHLIDTGKVTAVNGTVLATVTVADLEAWLKVALLAASLVYTVVKIVLALRGQKPRNR